MSLSCTLLAGLCQLLCVKFRGCQLRTGSLKRTPLRASSLAGFLCLPRAQFQKAHFPSVKKTLFLIYAIRDLNSLLTIPKIRLIGKSFKQKLRMIKT
ncbi:hypothetical protein L596_013560 [Steinernema carpocapsae]|uniref:Secreted protein n=1 Tax=Steinernema carpocapsae TaxID=34508 RepID=A0A4U5P175_STECR|nr:hypothetical protein L596_013560 [Steinernema carpocapsae]